MLTFNNLRFAVTASTCLTLVVGALALASYVLLFPPQYRGWGEVTNGGTEIAGWLVNVRTPEERVRVQLYVGERFIGEQVAELPRLDVVAAGFAADTRCGYRFQLPHLEPGTYIARIYAAHEVGNRRIQTLQLTGESLELRMRNEGGRMK